MSKKAYNTDLRTRVIQYIKEGNTQREAARIFKISKSAVNRWWNRYKKEGILQAKPKLGSKGKIDLKVLEEYVNEHPDVTLAIIAKKFNVTVSAIWKRLQKLSFSYKKKRSPTWKQMKKNDLII